MRFLIPATLYCLILCTDAKTHLSSVNICLQIHFISPSHQGTVLQEAERCLEQQWRSPVHRFLDLPFPAGVLQGQLGCFSQSCTCVPCVTPLPALKTPSGSSSPSEVFLVTWTAGIMVKMGVLFPFCPPRSCSQIAGSVALTGLDGAAQGDRKAPQKMQSSIPS